VAALDNYDSALNTEIIDRGIASGRFCHNCFCSKSIQIIFNLQQTEKG